MNAPQLPVPRPTVSAQRRVSEAFGAAASHYDQFAHIQRQCGAELLRALPPRSWPKVVDLGCGTGYLARQLLAQAGVVLGMDIAAPMLVQAASAGPQPAAWVGTDMHQLPLAANSVDLIVSNYAFQWSSEQARLLRELARVLTEDGCVAFAVPVAGTLSELQQAWQAADPSCQHVNEFKSISEWQVALKAAGFEVRAAQCRTDTEWVPSVAALSRQLRGMGAHRITRHQRSTLTGKSRWRAMCAHYGKCAGSDGRLPVSWVSWVVVAHRTGQRS